MRPNRVGIFPVSLENGTGMGSAVVDLSSLSSDRLDGIRSALNQVEIFTGVDGEIHDTIYSRTQHYDGTHDIELTEDLPRISFGGFVNVSGQRESNAEPQPLYVRMVGSCYFVTGNGDAFFIQPVIGLKEHHSPPSVGFGAADKLSRRLSLVRVLPIKHQAHAAIGSSNEIYTAETDITFALGKVFSRFGGTGFASNETFGVGWSVVMPKRTANTTTDLYGHFSFTMSAWFYTADLDMYDPNKS